MRPRHYLTLATASAWLPDSLDPRFGRYFAQCPPDERLALGARHDGSLLVLLVVLASNPAL